MSTTSTPYGTIPPASPMPQRRPVSLPRLQQMREAGEKITMLTAYDATFAAVADAAGVDVLLVGDSLGMVRQGLPSTVGVTLDAVRYHTESVVPTVLGRPWHTMPRESPTSSTSTPAASATAANVAS